MDAAIGQGRYEQKQSTALFAAQDPCQTKDFCYFSSLKVRHRQRKSIKTLDLKRDSASFRSSSNLLITLILLIKKNDILLYAFFNRLTIYYFHSSMSHKKCAQ